MAKGHIHIGTSGWHYKEWKGIYYPPDIRTRDWLSYYANEFATTEINSSFYRLPSEETAANWTGMVPDDFKFCPKMSRFLTHMKKLRDPEEPLLRFFSRFDPMLHKMGPILLQLPHMVIYNPDVVRHFFSLLKEQYGDYRFALEVRHESWLEDEPVALMKKYEIAFVISQSGVGWPYKELVTSKNIYVRFHGPRALYASSYDDDTLRYFASLFRKWKSKGHEVWAFFNNDVGCLAIENAKRLKTFLDQRSIR
jgi:uncharacterized protein YecE (DUF72 family)